MDKGILRLAEMIYVDRLGLYTFKDNSAMQDEARKSIKAAEVFYQVKGERELEVGK